MSASAIFTPPQPTFPSGGGGGGPILLGASTSESYYYFTNYNLNDVITVSSITNNQPQNGNVMVYMNMNISGNGFDTTIPLVLLLNGQTYIAPVAVANSGAPTSYSFNVSIPYTANDTDTYEFQFTIQLVDNVEVRITTSYVFYPTP